MSNFNTYRKIKSEEDAAWLSWFERNQNRQRNLRKAEAKRAAEAAAAGNVRVAWTESRNASSLRFAFEKARVR